MSELKPCPFCGGKAYLANPEPNALWRVICTNDCREGEYVSNRTAAIALWNTRTFTRADVEAVAGIISSAEARYAHTGDGNEDYDDNDRCRYVARAVIAHILGEG